MTDICCRKEDFESAKNELAGIQLMIQKARKVPRIRSFFQIKEHLSAEMMYLNAHLDRMNEADIESSPAKKLGPNHYLDLTDELVFPPTAQFLPTDLLMRKLITAAFQQWTSTNQ